MALAITASDAQQVGDGIWKFEMPAHQIGLFGNPVTSVGKRSIILLSKSNFDENRSALIFDLEDVVPLNIGTGPETIAVLSDLRSDRSELHLNTDGGIKFSPGDRQFLDLASELLPDHMQKAALALLTGVRSRSSGSLKRGKTYNFSDTPDNFWYVIIQPRIAQLSITVRGNVEHFRSLSKLPIKDDRKNTLFKITSEDDVPAALDLIFHAHRRR